MKNYIYAKIINNLSKQFCCKREQRNDMVSKVKYGPKLGTYKMRRITACFSTDVNDLRVREEFMLKVETVARPMSLR